MSRLFLVAVLVGAMGVSAAGQQRAAGAADTSLAAGSRKAILETGISEPYFDRHFRLVRVVEE
ncbi:MAG TPA: hypothetical protein VJ715_13530, partial [Pyrinomonadaceae bacterium]|nr:hypothetical protein [Pyrinomonadaceae bacterium]